MYVWRDFSPKGSAAMPISWQCPLTKTRGDNPQISPNFVSNHNILNIVTRNVEWK